MAGRRDRPIVRARRRGSLCDRVAFTVRGRHRRRRRVDNPMIGGDMRHTCIRDHRRVSRPLRSCRPVVWLRAAAAHVQLRMPRPCSSSHRGRIVIFISPKKTRGSCEFLLELPSTTEGKLDTRGPWDGRADAAPPKGSRDGRFESRPGRCFVLAFAHLPPAR